MPVVEYEKDIVISHVLTNVKESSNHLASAISAANGVHFPGGGFNWGSVKEKIENCRSDINSYYEWLSGQSNSMSSATGKNDDSLEGTPVEKIKPEKSIVK